MSDTIKQHQAETDQRTLVSIFGEFKTGDEITVSLIQRKCKVGYFTASRTFERLVKDGIIENNKVA